MNSIKTHGIVLKRSNLGETDKILTIFTERFGKIRAIAKGVRKIKSRLAGSLEPFMLLDLQLYEGKSFYTITGAIIVEEFSEIQSDLTKLSRCFFLGELIDRTVEENQKSEPIFKLFVSGLTLQGQALKNTSRKDEKHELLFWSVCLRIVGRAGFSPSLYECVHCHKKISPEQNYWDNIEGGVICSLCQSKFSHGKKISNETIKILRLMDQGNLTLLAKLNFEQEILTELKIVLDEYISAVLERELKSRRFLQENASTP